MLVYLDSFCNSITWLQKPYWHTLRQNFGMVGLWTQSFPAMRFPLTKAP